MKRSYSWFLLVAFVYAVPVKYRQPISPIVFLNEGGWTPQGGAIPEKPNDHVEPPYVDRSWCPDHANITIDSIDHDMTFLAQGYQSAVYRLDDDPSLLVKIPRPGLNHEGKLGSNELMKSYHTLSYLKSLGVPVPTSLLYTENVSFGNQPVATMMIQQRLNGPTMKQLMTPDWHRYVFDQEPKPSSKEYQTFTHRLTSQIKDIFEKVEAGFKVNQKTVVTDLKKPNLIYDLDSETVYVVDADVLMLDGTKKQAIQWFEAFVNYYWQEFFVKFHGYE